MANRVEDREEEEERRRTEDLPGAAFLTDERRGLPVELDGTSSSINSLARRRRHVEDMKRVEVGRMSGE